MPRQHVTLDYMTRDIMLGTLRELSDSWSKLMLNDPFGWARSFAIEFEAIWCSRYLEDAGL